LDKAKQGETDRKKRCRTVGHVIQPCFLRKFSFENAPDQVAQLFLVCLGAVSKYAYSLEVAKTDDIVIWQDMRLSKGDVFILGMEFT
jgi:hypothetical protein